MNFDITIIGGSFAGMTTALALAQVSPELKIAIIERQDILNTDRKRDGRAYAISSASLKLFKEIGIYDRLQPEAGLIADIKITDHKSPFFLDFLGQDVGGDLGQIIENYHIHNALRDRILQQKNITVFAPNFYEKIEFCHHSSFCHPERSEGSPDCNELGNEHVDGVRDPVQQRSQGSVQGDKSNGVSVKLGDGKILNSKLLLACDGRISKLRELFQIHTTVKKYHQTAIVFNISHQLPHQNIAHEKFFPGGPLAILPLKNPNHSSIVLIVPDRMIDAFMSLDEENFTHQLSKKMEGVLGDVKIISEKFSYPLIAIEAEKFFHEKMLLIGDAACGVHPIAGQGFNLAVSGIKILCEEIKLALASGLEISGSNVIESYNKKAKSEARKMLVATDILNSLFETKSLSIGLARDLGLGLVSKLPALKKFFIKNAGGF